MCFRRRGGVLCAGGGILWVVDQDDWAASQTALMTVKLTLFKTQPTGLGLRVRPLSWYYQSSCFDTLYMRFRTELFVLELHFTPDPTKQGGLWEKHGV